jgi:hypothetical protein
LLYVPSCVGHGLLQHGLELLGRGDIVQLRLQSLKQLLLLDQQLGLLLDHVLL